MCLHTNIVFHSGLVCPISELTVDANLGHEAFIVTMPMISVAACQGQSMCWAYPQLLLADVV
jgi:hypothetical protein